MPPKSRSKSGASSSSSLESIHDELYGHLFDAGVVKVSKTTTTLTLTKAQAAALSRVLGVVLAHPKVRKSVRPILEAIDEMLRAARANSTPLVFEMDSFTLAQDFHDTALHAVELVEDDEEDPPPLI